MAKHGFFSYRYVEALDPAAAEVAAIELLRQDERLRLGVRNNRQDPPVMDVSQIAEVDPAEVVDKPQPGFAWYEE